MWGESQKNRPPLTKCNAAACLHGSAADEDILPRHWVLLVTRIIHAVDNAIHNLNNACNAARTTKSNIFSDTGNGTHRTYCVHIGTIYAKYRQQEVPEVR